MPLSGKNLVQRPGAPLRALLAALRRSPRAQHIPAAWAQTLEPLAEACMPLSGKKTWFKGLVRRSARCSLRSAAARSRSTYLQRGSKP